MFYQNLKKKKGINASMQRLEKDRNRGGSSNYSQLPPQNCLVWEPLLSPSPQFPVSHYNCWGPNVTLLREWELGDSISLLHFSHPK